MAAAPAAQQEAPVHDGYMASQGAEKTPTDVPRQEEPKKTVSGAGDAGLPSDSAIVSMAAPLPTPATEAPGDSPGPIAKTDPTSENAEKAENARSPAKDLSPAPPPNDRKQEAEPASERTSLESREDVKGSRADDEGVPDQLLAGVQDEVPEATEGHASDRDAAAEYAGDPVPPLRGGAAE